jgi:hypothetical protein
LAGELSLRPDVHQMLVVAESLVDTRRRRKTQVA